MNARKGAKLAKEKRLANKAIQYTSALNDELVFYHFHRPLCVLSGFARAFIG